MIIKAYANSDHAYVVWKPNEPIEDCMGFAVYRRRDGKVEVLDTYVGPENGPKVPDGTHRPSTEWPIQKFMWADYGARSGDTVEYRVVPMCGSSFDDMKPDTSQASPWSARMTLGSTSDAPIRAYFNRGVVSTQWVARSLAKSGKSLLSLVKPPLGKTTGVRDFLGGTLKKELLSLIESHREGGGHLYAALFELSDPEVIPALAAYGKRAHIILSDGTHKAPAETNGRAKASNAKRKTAKGSQPYDENADARAKLADAHVDLHGRMVKGEHFCHHKFIVFADAKRATSPLAVWTGSTNLTYGGVCTQANNGIYVENKIIAQRFMAQWRELVKVGDDYPASLSAFDAKPLVTNVGKSKITTWFAPNPRVGSLPKKRTGNNTATIPIFAVLASSFRARKRGFFSSSSTPGAREPC